MSGSHRLAALACAGAALLIAGCGGGENAGQRAAKARTAYSLKLQVDGRAVTQALTVFANVSPKSVAHQTAKIDTAEKALRSAADDLAAASPPADAVADNTAILVALRQIQIGLEQLKSHPSKASSIVFAMGNAPQMRAAYRATADLERRGYDVGTLGGG